MLELRVLQDERAHALSQSCSRLPAQLLRQRRLRRPRSLAQKDARNLRERGLARDLALLALLPYTRQVLLDLILCRHKGIRRASREWATSAHPPPLARGYLLPPAMAWASRAAR